jgi:hypothetical protein
MRLGKGKLRWNEKLLGEVPRDSSVVAVRSVTWRGRLLYGGGKTARHSKQSQRVRRLSRIEFGLRN